MDYFIYFIVFAFFGCFFQCAVSILGFYALIRRKYDGAKFWVAVSSFSVILIIIRLLSNLDLIEFGLHTVIMMGCLILIGYFYLKSNVIKVILSSVAVFALITISEVIYFGIVFFAIGEDKMNKIFSANYSDVKAQTVKEVAGVPSNIILLIITLFLYIFLVKAKKRNEVPKNINDGFHEDKLN